ncbi:MAG: hypothetical protein JST58_03175 [Bacteroidetes bacterium]|nr:hypothetical protein [Bacteroidota bacterium]
MKTTGIIHPIREITCYLLVFLFIYTGVSKLLNGSSFEAVLLQSPLVRNYAFIISWALPVVELLIATLLLLRKSPLTGLMLSLIVLTVFTFYIGYMVLFVPSLPCSCGGVLKELSWRNHILFNLFFIILILISLLSLSADKIFIAINRKSRKPV